MGIGKSQFTEEELQDYQDLTYFTKKEVLHAHQKFKALAPEKVGHNRNAKLPMSKILQYPELKVNPFGDRICKVFSSSQDGDCTFEDFLDMMSVFSDGAPKAVKAEHAFRIFVNFCYTFYISAFCVIYGRLLFLSSFLKYPGILTLPSIRSKKKKNQQKIKKTKQSRNTKDEEAGQEK